MWLKQSYYDQGEKSGKLLAWRIRKIQTDRAINSIFTTKQVVSTCGSNVLSSHPQKSDQIAPCTHEEADTRMLLHAVDAARKGFKKITLLTVDTDVVVLAIAHVSELGIEELWVAFGTGKNFRYIPAHEIAKSLGPDKSKALPVLHAFTGCDTVSTFATRGKKTAWDTWNAFDMATEAFMALSKAPKSIP